MVPDEIHRDAYQPGFYAAFSPELREILIRPQEALLGQSVGCVPVFDQQQNHPVDAFLVQPHYFVKRPEGDGMRGHFGWRA